MKKSNLKKRLTIELTILILTAGAILFYKNSRHEIYPLTDKPPVMELLWPEELNVADVTRYTPYGIWESKIETNEGIAYEPANEMQFYVNTNAEDLLAVAPGIVSNSTKNESGGGKVTVRYGEKYSISYLHVIPKDDLDIGQKIETGDVLGKMEKKINPHNGEETWWEVMLVKHDNGVARTLLTYANQFFLKNK